MAINQLFAHFKTEAGFKAKLEAGEINENGISFIKENHQFYTHGEYYHCNLTEEQIDAIIKSFIVNDTTTGGTDKIFSAEQGKLLQEALVELQETLDAYKEEAEGKFEKVENKNTANGYAGLDENGKIDPSLVSGVVGHVLGVEQFVDANPDVVEDGKYYFNTTSKKILFGEEGAWVETDPQSQVLYNRRGEDESGHANTLYRWDGEQMTAVSDPIALGEVTGTAYDGKKGADNRAAIISAPEVVTQIGELVADANGVTIPLKKAAKKADNMGYESAVEGSIVIPAATGTNAGLMSAADKEKIDALLGSGEPGEGETLPEKIDSLQEEVAALKENTVNGKKISENPVINGADVKLDGFAPLPEKEEGYTEGELTPAATDTVNQAVAKLLRVILDNEEVEAAAIAKLNNSLGFNENAEFVPTNPNLEGKSVTEAVDYVVNLIVGEGTGEGQTVIEQIENKIEEAITNIINGASEGFQTFKDLEDALKAEIARATAAEEAIEAKLEWYEGD